MCLEWHTYIGRSSPRSGVGELEANLHFAFLLYPVYAMSRTASAYAPLATNDADTEKLLEQPTPPTGWSDDTKGDSLKRKLNRWLPWILHVVLLLTSLMVFLDAHWVKNNAVLTAWLGYVALTEWLSGVRPPYVSYERRSSEQPEEDKVPAARLPFIKMLHLAPFRPASLLACACSEGMTYVR